MSDQPLRLRVGRHWPMHLYRVLPDGLEEPVGTALTAELAAQIVAAVNGVPEIRAALNAEADRVHELGGQYNEAVAVGLRAAARMIAGGSSEPVSTPGEPRLCGTCAGVGWPNDRPCKTCDGTGEEPADVSVARTRRPDGER